MLSLNLLTKRNRMSFNWPVKCFCRFVLFFSNRCVVLLQPGYKGHEERSKYCGAGESTGLILSYVV